MSLTKEEQREFNMRITGRAVTRQDKIDILKRLLNIWDENRELRLGQLIVNCIKEESLFQIEDTVFINKLTDHYVSKRELTEMVMEDLIPAITNTIDKKGEKEQ